MISKFEFILRFNESFSKTFLLHLKVWTFRDGFKLSGLSFECFVFIKDNYILSTFHLIETLIMSSVLRDFTPRFVGPSVGRLVGRSHFTFFMIIFLWPHSSCQNGLETSNMAPAHPHATSVAVYPALLIIKLLIFFFLLPFPFLSPNL